MNTQRKIQMIKVVCWTGVAADGFWTLALLWPRLFAVLTENQAMSENLSVQLIALTAASLMAGWTILLVWTAQEPIERRAVLLFTAIPVVAGLFSLTWVGYTMEQGKSSWILFKTAGLFVAMLWAFFTANTIAKKAKKTPHKIRHH